MTSIIHELLDHSAIVIMMLAQPLLYCCYQIILGGTTSTDGCFEAMSWNNTREVTNCSELFYTKIQQLMS